MNKISHQTKLAQNTTKMVEKVYKLEMRECGDWVELIALSDAIDEGRMCPIPKGWELLPSEKNGYDERAILTNIKNRCESFERRYRRDDILGSRISSSDPNPNLPYEIGTIPCYGPAEKRYKGDLIEYSIPGIRIWSDGEFERLKHFANIETILTMGIGDYCGYCGSFLGRNGEDRYGWECPYCGGV